MLISHALCRFFWRSQRGFHVLFHEFNNPQGSGGYAYSKDAVTWTTANNAAYSMALNFSTLLAPPFNGTQISGKGSGSSEVRYQMPACQGGGVHCIARRERPELVFAEPPNSTHRYSEHPLYLLNGVQTACEGVPTCEAIYGRNTKRVLIFELISKSWQ
jgi:hypothetical protein